MRFFTNGFVEIETVLNDEEWKEAETHRFVDSIEEATFRQMDQEARVATRVGFAVPEVERRLTRR